MRRINHLPKFFKIIFFYCITSFIVLISTELLLSTFKEKPSNNKIVRSINFREHYPNKFERNYKYKKVNGKIILSDEVDLSTDSNGYINPSIIHNKDSINILFLGGSTTENRFLNEFTRFPYLVGRNLDSKIRNLNFNSINSAVSGNNSLHSLNIFINKGIWIPAKPEIAVLMHAINDLISLAYNNSYYIVDKPRAMLLTKDVSKFDTRFIKYQLKRFFPHLINRLVIFFDKIKQKNVLERDEFKEYRGKEIEVNTALIKKLFKSSLNNFIETAKSWEIKPVLMTQPNLFLNERIYGIERGKSLKIVKTTNLNYVEFQELYDEFNQITRDLANEKNILLIDLEKTIPKDRIYFQVNNDIHFNNKGSTLAAEIISDELIKRFFTKKRILDLMNN